MDKLRVGLLFGGRSEEHEISILSARSILENYAKEKYEMIPFAISKEGYWLNPEESKSILLDNKIDKICYKKDKNISESLIPFLEEEFDVVFPVIHGPFGEDGKVQGLLDTINIPYVGAGVLGSALGMDKAMMKDIFSFNKIPQGRYIILNNLGLNDNLNKLTKEITEKIGWPCFIKPANMGSSIGISKVFNSEQLKQALKEGFKYDNKIVIEEFINGRELECSVLGNEEIRASLPGEILSSHEFYNYEAKYKDQSTELIIPVKLDKKIEEDVRKIAIKAFKSIGGSGFARVDFFLIDNKTILVNEINTIPGFTEYSMYPKLWEATGISYSNLIDILIDLALKRQSF